MSHIATGFRGFEKAPPTNIEHCPNQLELADTLHVLAGGDELVSNKLHRKQKELLAQTLLGFLSLFSLAKAAFSRAAAQTLFGRPAAWWSVRSLFLAATKLVKSTSGNGCRVKVMLECIVFLRNLEIDQI